MSVDPKALAEKIKEMYPEIGKRSLEMGVSFDAETDSWLVHLKKGKDELKTHIEVKDAENCLQGVECVYLGVQVSRFIEAYCLRGDSCDV